MANLHPVVCRLVLLRPTSLAEVFQMSSLEQRLAAVNDIAANLILQLNELKQLRDQVRKAKRSARGSGRLYRRKLLAFRHKKLFS
jgi:hypothetical protein